MSPDLVLAAQATATGARPGTDGNHIGQKKAELLYENLGKSRFWGLEGHIYCKFDIKRVAQKLRRIYDTVHYLLNCSQCVCRH